MFRSRVCFLAAVLMTLALPAFGQGNPTGTLSGHVVDQGNLPLPGATVTAKSPALQGARIAVTSANGDYIIPFLPAGEYTVVFTLPGFSTVTQTVGLKMADVLPVNAKMGLASVTAAVTVTAAEAETAPTATVATTLKAETVELLPIGRSLASATLFSPAASNNGPSGNIMISGALSYDNLNLVNGVNINETQRQQPRTLFIEDAIQETKVSAGNISAEYGRFQGGVVNMITKSGGNVFSGSFRTTFTNDDWRSLTPYPGDSAIDKIVPAYELTFGGPILRDKLWFFLAGRLEQNETNVTAPYTGFNYTRETDDQRAEGKLTWSLNQSNTAKVSYLWKRQPIANDSFGTIMDQASLYDDRTDESLLAANFQSVVTGDLFLEGQYSARKMELIDQGSRYMDQIYGTPIWDRSRGQARFSAPTYCAVCPNYANKMDNWDAYVKGNYFLSTKSLGTHSIVAGVDVFHDTRKNNQNSSASEYRVQSSGAIIDGYNIYPIFKTGTTTYVEWLPVFEDTVGSDLGTTSGFLNDTWRVNDLLTLNLGVRYDKNDISDQGGKNVADAGIFSPRLGATFDIRRDGTWLANVGYGQYVGTFITQIADAASPAGRQASYSFYYAGPNVNTGATGPYLNSYDALKVLFTWWNSTGGPNRKPRQNPTIPGVNTAVDPGVQPAVTKEYSVGVAHQLGTKGAVRVDYVYRKFGEIYGNYLDMSTGVVTDPTSGQQYNLTVVNNTDSVERSYQGLSVQARYQASKAFLVGANYMLSYTRGSIEAENAASVTNFSDANYYPEYRQAGWNTPYGYLNADQRHRLRIWGTYELPLPAAAGRFDLGFQERYESGRPYDLSMSVDSRPYVTNPGYLAPPSTVTYFVSGRGAYRFDASTATDLSLSWSHGIPGWEGSELFVRFVMNNVFNEHALTSFNTTVLSKSNDSTLQAFNPFTTTPVEGVNWKKGPSFGQATSPNSYQDPRNYYFSVGLRF